MNELLTIPPPPRDTPEGAGTGARGTVESRFPVGVGGESLLELPTAAAATMSASALRGQTGGVQSRPAMAPQTRTGYPAGGLRPGTGAAIVLLEPDYTPETRPPEPPPAPDALQEQFLAVIKKQRGESVAAQIRAALSDERKTQWVAPQTVRPTFPTVATVPTVPTVPQASRAPQPSSAGTQAAPPRAVTETELLQMLRSLTSSSPEARALFRQIEDAHEELRRFRSLRSVP